MDFGIPSHPAPSDPPGEDFSATAGEPLADGVTVAGEEALIEAFKTVFDPEIPVNIYELGLIYEFDIDEKGAVAGEMPQWVADAAAKVDGVGEAKVTLVWEPTWGPELMSEDAKLALGIMDD